jgi:predicted transcriptional regulator
VKLTELEKDVIVAITENEYSDVPGNPVWSWSVADNCKITHKDQVSGVVSSLVKKGLVECYDDRGKDSTVHLTDAGIKVYHGIKEKG